MMTILSALSQPTTQVQILTTNESETLITGGYIGLSNTIHIQGLIRIKTPLPLVTVSATLQGSIITSNGDARRHSPYESFRFLTLGPQTVFSIEDDATQTNATNPEPGVWLIPFSFPLSSSTNKLHTSIHASNPEWGFGARIAYRVEAVVQVGTRVTRSQLSRSLETMIPYAHLLFSAYESLFLNTLTSHRPLVVTKHHPTALKSILQASDSSHPSQHTWSSETDVFEDHQNLGTGYNLEYTATLTSTVFGPTDRVEFTFQMRAKPGTRTRIDSVRVWLEEVQGVGISVEAMKTNASVAAVRRSCGNKPEAVGGGMDFADLMEGTTLDRKYLGVELLVWEGREAEEGDFWNATQQLKFDVPRLASSIPTPTSMFATKHSGINPSGTFANRICIDHKFRIRVTTVTSRGDPLPAFELPPKTVQVTPFNILEAEFIVSSVPTLLREVVRDSKNASLVRRLLAKSEDEYCSSVLEKRESSVSLDETVVDADESEVEDLGRCKQD
ncbi:hypothetical protein HDU98_002588 [Podochytrium sp. JEL0797]|nr:hypothetical protein HDU98_002588 [Podochytrium sp. JEL0797]